MAGNNVNALVSQWNTTANLNLTSDQQQQLQTLLTTAGERTTARRAGAQQVFQQLATAVQSNDNATAEQLLQKVREGLRQAGEARERFLDQFDQVLQPTQRAQLVVALVQQAQQSGRPVEQFVEALLGQAGSQN